MAELFLHISVSLDGYIEDAQGDIEWMTSDTSFDDYSTALLPGSARRPHVVVCARRDAPYPRTRRYAAVRLGRVAPALSLQGDCAMNAETEIAASSTLMRRPYEEAMSTRSSRMSRQTLWSSTSSIRSGASVADPCANERRTGSRRTTARSPGKIATSS